MSDERRKRGADDSREEEEHENRRQTENKIESSEDNGSNKRLRPASPRSILLRRAGVNVEESQAGRNGREDGKSFCPFSMKACISNEFTPLKQIRFFLKFFFIQKDRIVGEIHAMRCFGTLMHHPNLEITLSSNFFFWNQDLTLNSNLRLFSRSSPEPACDDIDSRDIESVAAVH